MTTLPLVFAPLHRNERSFAAVGDRIHRGGVAYVVTHVTTDDVEQHGGAVYNAINTQTGWAAVVFAAEVELHFADAA